MKKVFSYIATNSSMPGSLKIGASIKVPDERLKELFTTGVPDPFKPSYCCLVENSDKNEKEIHKKLSYCRITVNREFFRVDLKTAIDAIRQHCKCEHEWSDEVALKSPEGIYKNLRAIRSIHGIDICSRRDKES